MLQRGKEHEALFAGMRNNVRVNDYATAPRDPVGPRRLLNTAVAFSLSLGLGLGLAVLLGFMDDKLRSADDVRRALPAVAVASVPAVGARRRLMLHAPRRDGPRPRHGLLLDGDAPAPLAEAFRQLRTSVLLAEGGRNVKSLLVTSAMPGEGKTTTAVNTAVSLARTGAFVLLVDADLRNPRLHSIFGLKNERGLSTLLSDESDETGALRAVTPDAASRIDVLPSGPMTPESAELLSSAQMRRLVQAYRAVYDYVVIDSPPLAFFSDGVQLSALADGVVLVVNSGDSSGESARRSYQALHDVGANVCGVVLNNAEGNKFNYERYYKSA